MAISGKLGDIGFVELLKLVGKKTGRLSISISESQRHEWYIHEMRVYAIRINQQPVSNQNSLFETALKLINDEFSPYNFVNREALDKFPIEMSFNIEQLIAEVLTRLTPDAPCSFHFPNPDTKFESIPNGKVSLSGETEDFWKRSQYFFLSGKSPNEIARELNFPLSYVRLEFYRLRVLGMIAPVRVFSSAANAKTFPKFGLPVLPDQPSSVNLPNQTLPPATIASESNSSPPPVQTPSPPRIFYGEKPHQPQYKPYVEKPQKQERQNLVRRMLGALFNR